MMSRLLAVTIEVLFLVVCFLISAAISAYACSVTNRTIIEASLDDCTETPYAPSIYKTETNRITFSDGDFDNVQTYGLGHCGSPSVSGSWTKCYPDFNTPTTGSCTPSACNCVRWSQFIQGKMDNCGLFSCSCQNSNTHEQFYLEEECWDESCGGNGGCSGCTEQSCPGQCFEGCCTQTPIVIDVAGNGFDLTNVANGVAFDVNMDGTAEHLAWTSAGTDDAWLVLDRNGNGTIENGSELFGEFAPQSEPAIGERKNGFMALAEFDKLSEGGNADGSITSEDSIFDSLRLWQDTNHNGVSETSELKSLSELGLLSIQLDYKSFKKTDENGNRFRYRARVHDTKATSINRWAWDVLLLSTTTPSQDDQ